MTNEIISYLEMCQREGASLQRGMNYRLGKNYSVILMSQRANAPYQDHIENDGTVLVYEGHDVPRSKKHPIPKAVDQPGFTPNGLPTENGKFFQAARSFIEKGQKPERVQGL